MIFFNSDGLATGTKVSLRLGPFYDPGSAKRHWSWRLSVAQIRSRLA